MTRRAPLEAGSSRLRRGPRHVRDDLLLASVVGFTGLAEILGGAVVEHRAVAAVVMAGMAVALTHRRSRPLAVVATVLVLLLAQTRAGVPENAQLATLACVVIATYSLGAHARRGRAVVGLLLGVGLVTVLVSLEGGGATSDYGFGALLVAGPWTAGLLVRVRDEAAADATRTASAVAETADAQARQAAQDERARIARELHDIVSHGLSGMIVQATAAAEMVDANPAGARAAMLGVREAGRDAMEEMHHLLGVLRGPAAQPRGPQPTLDDVADLVRAEQASGRRVSFDVAGTRRPLPRGLALSAYRIVQEALTNVRKHAADASAEVRIGYRPDAVEVLVLDDGEATVARPDGAGYGLAGMRERAALYGGRIEAGPRTDADGWFVHASFPVEDSVGTG